MTKVCPHCKTGLPEDWQFPRCPYCGGGLPKEEEQSASALSMGDANAISGGVHIDSHNVVTNNITHVERDKTDKELAQEGIVRYKKLCQQLYADGRLDPVEAKQLEDLRLTIGLDEETAKEIQEQVRKVRLLQSGLHLNPVAKVAITQVVNLAKAGNTNMLKLNLPRLEMMSKKYDVDEVQFYYYALLSALDPTRCIETYENRSHDNYWLSFWTYLAYLNTDQIGEAENILTNMEIFSDYPYGNITLLAATSSMYQYWDNPQMADYLDQANMFLEQGSVEHSDLLDRYTQVLMILLDSDNEGSIKEFQQEFLFYFKYIFNTVMEKKKRALIRMMIPPIPKIAPLPH